ncbi:MAG: ATP-binding cassette domain-containing protein, partial [Nonomuraea sp.]|nr:ATP-binding cassette domain-containing protein [Nonomuraea sp.]
MTPLLAVTSLVKKFGQVTAVDDVSFELMPGSCLGIVGESGSGKTTAARVLAGLERPTSGTVTLDGHDVQGQSRLWKARRLQMIFQDP